MISHQFTEFYLPTFKLVKKFTFNYQQRYVIHQRLLETIREEGTSVDIHRDKLQKEREREKTRRSWASFTGNRSATIARARNLSGRTRRHRVEDSSEREHGARLKRARKNVESVELAYVKRNRRPGPGAYDERSGDQQEK